MMTPRFATTLALCARQERTLAVRSRWMQVFAAVFAALAMGVASSGYILTGGHGVQAFGRTAASLLQLVVLLIPLTALVMGVLALASERGAAELLYSQPIDRRGVLLGRLLGLIEALVCAEALGFGLSGWIIFAQNGGEGIGSFTLLFAAAVALTVIFLAIAGAIASAAIGQRRTRALAIAIVVWFIAVLLFDLTALGIASPLRSGPASRVLIASVLINPVDAVRTGTLLAIEGTAAFGSASLALLRFTKGPAGAALLVAASVVVWIVIPMWVAARRLNRADL
jgi:Cu-processing system permease protein